MVIVRVGLISRRKFRVILSSVVWDRVLLK